VRPLNLASQPFRNETLPAVLFGAASLVLVVLTVQHALMVRSLLPARTSKLHREVASLEAEAERLRAEAGAAKTQNPDSKVVAEWVVLKDLVDRRTFSWTGLFARLEEVLPREVRLISIAPDVAKGHVTLDITAVARPPQAGLGLVGVLEGRPEFEDVYPMSIAEQQGGTAEFQYTMRYLPGAAGTAVVVPAAAVVEDEEEDEEPSETSTAAPADGAAAPGPAPGSTPGAAPPAREPRETRPGRGDMQPATPARSPQPPARRPVPPAGRSASDRRGEATE
jgi:hypothetical protein